MAVTVRFTPNLARHVAADAVSVRGATVREVVDAALPPGAPARGWVLDEAGNLRRHMTVFVDGELIRDRARLGDPVRDGAEVWIMQALSGG